MPRGKKIAVKVGATKSRASAKVNHEDAARISELLRREEEVIEADMHQEIARMIDERDLKMSHDLNDINNRNKRLMMWVGVTVAMLVVVVIWVSTLGFAVNNNYRASEKQIDGRSLAEYKQNLDQTFAEVMTKIEQLKEQSKQMAQLATSSTSSLPLDSQQE
jgi:cell division protein FtsL